MDKQTAFLYVEDDPFSCDALSVVLKRVMGFTNVFILPDSDDFIARVQALPSKPDVFLLDIHMAPHDGFEMLKMLRGEPVYAKSPVVALTASVMNEEVDLLRSSGFDGAIGKPIDIDLLPSIITKIVKGEGVWHIT